MIKYCITYLCAALAVTTLMFSDAMAQTKPLRIEITQGVIEPMPFAAPVFVAENAAARKYAQELTSVLAADLVGTGLFREIPNAAHISKHAAPLRMPV